MNNGNSVLVTGGMGYIGLRTTWQPVDASRWVVVLDIYSGHRWAIHPRAVIEGNAGNIELKRFATPRTRGKTPIVSVRSSSALSSLL
ncbi:MAG TPA: hypothetical protein VJS66_02470 [Burkholderiales bacterium]|nr:hypothetical protein [Burkholderiales bacterium]